MAINKSDLLRKLHAAQMTQTALSLKARDLIYEKEAHHQGYDNHNLHDLYTSALARVGVFVSIIRAIEGNNDTSCNFLDKYADPEQLTDKSIERRI